MALPLSCFIIAKNEADRIQRTIRAVKGFVDEVVVIDSGSTDGTQGLAEAEGARVIFHEWPGFGQQKRFGETQCRNEWLLNLDADEVVSPALATEIQALFANGEPALAVYALPINDVYPGKTRPRLWANDYVQPRLYDRRRVRFKDSPIHDSLDIAGMKVGALEGDVHHFSARSFDDQMAKAVERGRYFADHAKRKSAGMLRLRLVFEFPAAFLRYYFLRRHFTGGLAGFQSSMIGAVSRFVRISRMLEAMERPQTQRADDLNQRPK
ncbi:MAG: glycosyltransferase family 2 protein [Alphaproteobacteria bacterium]|nr:glycosyltransferase family 2 protein [Alphaproteobacteria bacterium]